MFRRLATLVVVTVLSNTLMYGQDERMADRDHPEDKWPETIVADPADPLYGPWNKFVNAMNSWARDYFRYGVNDLRKQRKARDAIKDLVTSDGWTYCEPFCKSEKQTTTNEQEDK